jgi:DNA (cytosine-5)-methyltransferase 1
MTSPPCQAFSLSGKRLGKDDKRGILFFNSHEFIQVNKPRFFIFENVKGLLSDDGGKTFQEWVNMLGGKSVNGVPVIFPYEDSVYYHLYWKVLNAKEHGVPQNRERVFLIGIRDDQDNVFQFPKEEHLIKRLKDVLEDNVDDKYFLSVKMLNYFYKRSSNFNNGKVNFKGENDYALCITKSSGSIDISDNIICIGNTNPSGNGINGNIFDENGIAPTLTTNKGEGIKIKSNYFRRLTPREAFRLMDFPETFDFSCVSDSQAYKQAGNSIVVNVLYKILKQLPL